MTLQQMQINVLPDSTASIEMGIGYTKMVYANEKGPNSISLPIVRKCNERLPNGAIGTATKDLDFFICFDALVNPSPCATKGHR
jgi:hypothetical protein